MKIDASLHLKSLCVAKQKTAAHFLTHWCVNAALFLKSQKPPEQSVLHLRLEVPGPYTANDMSQTEKHAGFGCF